MTDDENKGTPLISDADAAYLRLYLPPNIYGELLSVLRAMPADLRPLLTELVRREAEPMGEGALALALARLSDATNPPEDTP